MNKRKLIQSAWLAAGVFFLFAFISQVRNPVSLFYVIIYGLTSLVMFINVLIWGKMPDPGGKGRGK